MTDGTGAAPDVLDRGAQAERTALAWQRTGLTAAAAGLLLVHAHPAGHPVPPWPGLLLAAAGAVIAAVLAPVRYVHVQRAVRAGTDPRSIGVLPATALTVLVCIVWAAATLLTG